MTSFPRILALLFFMFAPGFTSMAATQPIKLVVSDRILPRDDNVGVSGQAARAVLKAFETHYPAINVVRFGGINLQDSGMDIGPLMAIAADVAPDVLYVNFRKSNSYIEQGFLYPLDEFIEQMPPQALEHLVLPAVRPVLHTEGPDHLKHWWALPFGNLVIALFYRKDFFHEAGLDPERPPKTWDEFLEDARKLTDPRKGRYGAGFLGGPASSWSFYSFLLSAGARAVERNQAGEWNASFDTPQAVEAAYFYTRLAQQRFHSDRIDLYGCVLRDVDIDRFWDEGKLGMFQAYLDDKLIATVNPEQVGIAPIPLGPTGLRASEINSTCMGIYGGIKDPEKRQAAWNFIQFWCSPEAARIRVKTYVENGYGQFVNPADLRKYGYKEYLKRVPKGWEEIYHEAMNNGVPEPYGKNCDLVYWYMTKPLDQALIENLGNADPAFARQRLQELMHDAVAECDEKMMGIVSPEKMIFRLHVAMLAAVAILAAFGLAFRYLSSVFTPEGGKGTWQVRRYWMAYLFLVPAVLLMAVWQYLPTLRGAAIAFMDYKIMGGSQFIGLKNFANVLFDSAFWQALGNSLYYAFLTLVLGFSAPIILAILLHEVPKGKVFFRLVFYLPSVVSGLVVIFLWKSFYDPSPAGLLNRVIGLLGIPPKAWLQAPQLAMLSVVLPLVWASMGPGSLIYLAALKTIPEEIYEAADIDGANVWQKLWNITLPSLKPLLVISFVGAFITAFKASDFILAMTGGGPAGSTTVLDLRIFYDAFAYQRFGPATAMAWLLGFMLLGFTVYQLKRLSQMQFTVRR